jgi:hypothetical protein
MLRAQPCVVLLDTALSPPAPTDAPPLALGRGGGGGGGGGGGVLGHVQGNTERRRWWWRRSAYVQGNTADV